MSYFPQRFNTYYEPFLGSGAVLATLSPQKACASDVFPPLIEIWTTLRENPELLKRWYRERWESVQQYGKREAYVKIKAAYNRSPNGADLLFLCRTCYGGGRFRKADGYMSTPCGIHEPIRPESFAERVDEWHQRTKGAVFFLADYREIMERSQPGDLIYCDPPYRHSQGILYGAQDFNLLELFDIIRICKAKEVFVALSIDGMKKSGRHICELPIPEDLFEREVYVNCGASMLKRFQMEGRTLHEHEVADRLLLTY